ncbi:MAG: excinuclease ABC subunit UvrB [Candidatus Cloacimonetes bacterium]|nr:excinuclease ABC subunit UvrB [Candidatus Cloacimonadota bacterium]
MMKHFELISDYKPKGDQPQAVKELTKNVRDGAPFQTLLGVTGSGKTFTIANVIKNVEKPTLIISHNKTLAAQLFGEMKQLFPNNAVEYFVSYYDYYQPEAYLPVTDTYIEKDADVNEQIDKLRLRATMSLMERRDVIIVASVSCIYGLGVPEQYRESLIDLKVGQELDREELLHKLVDIYYARNDFEFQRGTFRVRGDVVEIYPAYLENSIRVEFDFNRIIRLYRINPLTGEILEELEEYAVYPAKHFITSPEHLERALENIKKEMTERVEYFKSQNMWIEAQRIQQRTSFDLEMLREVGYVSGIENYSRHLSGRKEGERPACLLDYFPDDYLMIIDESHATIPQVHAMYGGDFSRKKALVDNGFRLPSAYDNRPLKFHEFEHMMNQVIFMSATPAAYELNKSEGVIVEQIVRPTGLIDPEIELKKAEFQVDDLLDQIQKYVEKNQRILVTTLTKKMAEDLTNYVSQIGIKAKYLHSEVHTLDRTEIIRDLRLGEFDVLIGVNLLREGLDLPEVALVAILDADKAGFLRSERSLIQTAGRAARHIDGKVIFYADRVSEAMQLAIDETNRRRKIQKKYNEDHNITPESISKTIESIMQSTSVAEFKKEQKKGESDAQQKKLDFEKYLEINSKEDAIELLTNEMNRLARDLRFEEAAEIRDRILELKEM